MSDFFRSLDRALEHEDGAYERFVAAVPRAIISQDDKVVTFRITPNIKAIQAKVNEDVARLAAPYDWVPRDTGIVDWYDVIDPMGTE